MLRKRVAPHSEVIRVIVLEDSPCCEGAAPRACSRSDGTLTSSAKSVSLQLQSVFSIGIAAVSRD